MTGWKPPDGVSGDHSAIKVSVGMLGPARFRCPARDAIAARPGLRAETPLRRKPEFLEDFANGPFMRAMDLIEHRGRTVDQALRTACASTAPGRVVHAVVEQWAAHGVSGYLRAFGDVPEMVPASEKWRYYKEWNDPDHRGAKRYAISVWGRCYTSANRRTRELRLLTNRAAGRVRTEAEVAVAGLVLASALPQPLPERVRIQQFALLEGTTTTLFDGSRQAALDLFDVAGKPALAGIVDAPDGLDYQPGPACADCPFAAVCPVLPRSAGLLGVKNERRPRRTWSATTSRSHRRCPAQEFSRRQRLPLDQSVERSAAAERGRAVHRYLEDRHGASAPSPCNPRIPGDWLPGGFELPEGERELGAELLRHHAEVCPLNLVSSPADVRVEPNLVFEDTDADTVVLAKPDLLYLDRGGWVWREVKTSATTGRQPQWFDHYPQLALAVVLAARGDLGPGHSRVELEVLRPSGVDLIVFDPCTPRIRAEAESTVREQFRSWHLDDQFTPEPGKQCRSCEVARWCVAADGERNG
ncbi:MAG: PD-(D/E)XK nuclease family protein [Actinomycetota bacterium]|nr:PD-(D/E)XK nuclease family protein [Actinomycetota bacterium]